MKGLKIYTDGGARGNPGPAAIGVVVKDGKDKILFETGKAIGKATNNQAEYKGLILALNWLKENSDKTIEKVDCFLDSKLVVSQMKGLFRVKSANVRSLWQEAKEIENSIDLNIDYHHIPRELNSHADRLLNSALDLVK